MFVILSDHSQFGEVEFLLEHVTLPKRGVYVDVGAGDGVTDSNSYHFERRGWSGVCIEPHPRSFASLLANRNGSCRCVPCAIGLGSSLQAFHQNQQRPSWSGLCRAPLGRSLETIVAVRRLDDVLDEAGIKMPDLLSIDTEGSELEVLATLDLVRFRPGIIIIEYNTWGGRKLADPQILEYFATRPYRLIHRTPANLLLERTPDPAAPS